MLVLAGCEESPTHFTIPEIHAKSILWGEGTAEKPSFTIMGDPDLFGIRLSWPGSTLLIYRNILFFWKHIITGTYLVNSNEYPITITAL
jgi:hypothetical protein